MVGMLEWLAYGEPSWIRFTDGRFDVMPVVAALVMLFVWRALFGARIRWQIALGTLLVGALFVDFGGGAPLLLAVVVALLTGPIVTRTGRPNRPSDQAPPAD